MKFIKDHSIAVIITVLCIILMILAAIAVYSMFNPSNSKSIYGNRLKDEVLVEDSIINEIIDEISSKEIVNTVTYKKNIRIMKFFIDIKDETKITDATKLTEIIIEKLSKDITDYYDIEVYLTGNITECPAIGYHSTTADTFTWVINKSVGEESE